MNVKPCLWSHRKIKWANADIKKLEIAVRTRFAPNSYRRISHLNAEGTEEIYEFRPRNVPETMVAMTKNILQNLREPLDNMVADLSYSYRGKVNNVSFPFGDDMQKYRAELEKLEKLLPDGAIDLIEQAQTQVGGNGHLRALHYYTRDQRHRRPIEPINLGTAFSLGTLIMNTGQLIRLGYRHGSHMIPDVDRNLIGVPGHQPEFDINGSLRAVFQPNLEAGDNQMEFITVTPGSKFECDIEPSISVALAPIATFKREPLIVSLKQMSQLVEGIVLTFEKRFFP